MKCFVIMPFTESFDPVFDIVKDAAYETIRDANFQCYWLKDIHAAGRITDDILRGLTEAAFCIADVTGHNPNVMWETGYAMALGKPTILIGQDIASLPFDLRSHRVLDYSPNALPEFQRRLEKAIQDTLARYELKGTGTVEPSATSRAKQMTITVTGTMNANEAAVCQRIQRFLSPYLSDTTSWLVGAVGTVDLASIRFLLDHRQRVTAVGYNRFDCAPELRALIDEGRLGFLDASVEAVPRGMKGQPERDLYKEFAHDLSKSVHDLSRSVLQRMKGPTERDIIFCIKSDLVILLWDGESQGTKEMVQYFKDQGMSTLLAFT
jgi:hypothetical protein